MPNKERKESAIANDLRLVAAPHNCAGGNVGLFAGTEGTVDVTTSQGRILTGVPVGQYSVLPVQLESVEATSVSPLYELIQS